MLLEPFHSLRVFEIIFGGGDFLEGVFAEGSFYPKCPFLKGENTKNELRKRY